MATTPRISLDTNSPQPSLMKSPALEDDVLKVNHVFREYKIGLERICRDNSVIMDPEAAKKLKASKDVFIDFIRLDMDFKQTKRRDPRFPAIVERLGLKQWDVTEIFKEIDELMDDLSAPFPQPKISGCADTPVTERNFEADRALLLRWNRDKIIREKSLELIERLSENLLSIPSIGSMFA